MTAIKVVDASAIAAILFAEPDGEAMVEQLAESRLIAPTLLHIELANVCIKKCRRTPDLRRDLIAGFELRVGLGIEEMPIDPSAVLALSLKTKLTAYDACYLWLALKLDAELVTLDESLAKAWVRSSREE